MIKDLFRLIRLPNLIFIAILMYVMEYWVAVPVLSHLGFDQQLTWLQLVGLILAVICIAAGGYVINDYFDVKIDRINRPDKIIVTESVSKVMAMRLFQVLTIIGLLLGLGMAFWLRDVLLASLFIFVPGLMWFYSSSYKRLFLIGNIIVSFASALTPLVIALANTAVLRAKYAVVLPYIPLEHDIYAWLGGFSLFAFLTTYVREIIKDLQDQMGDRELECHTMPIVLGEKWTKIVVSAVLLLIIALIAYFSWGGVMPFSTAWNTLACRYVVFGLLVPLAGEMALLWTAKIPSDYYHAQLLMKFVMFMGVMFGFVIMRSL